MLWKWFARMFGYKVESPRQIRKSVPRNQHRTLLEVEELGKRILCVVGATAPLSEVAHGSGFDGVVRLERGPELGSGVLLESHFHILTAAHNVTKLGDARVPVVQGATTITFDLVRDGERISIPIVAPGTDQFQMFHDEWNFKLPEGNDIAVVKLTDQDRLFDPDPNRYLIAPFGADRYGFFQGNPIGQQFTIAGYGRTGTGELGTTEEIQRIKIANPKNKETFTLTFLFETGESISIDDISQKATAAEVARKLTEKLGDGFVAVDSPGRLPNVPTSEWDIRFTDKRVKNVKITGVTEQGEEVGVVRRVGSDSSGIRRVGQNRYDQLDSKKGNLLQFDFDGQPANEKNGIDAIGGDPGLDKAEAFTARGDSGGPGLIRNQTTGKWEIAGVSSFDEFNHPKDFTKYVTTDPLKGVVPYGDSSFGEIGNQTYVKPYIDTFIKKSTLINGPYDLVLDMN